MSQIKKALVAQGLSNVPFNFSPVDHFRGLVLNQALGHILDSLRVIPDMNSVVV